MGLCDEDDVAGRAQDAFSPRLCQRLERVVDDRDVTETRARVRRQLEPGADEHQLDVAGDCLAAQALDGVRRCCPRIRGKDCRDAAAAHARAT
jgi:hypothetical protein